MGFVSDEYKVSLLVSLLHDDKEVGWGEFPFRSVQEVGGVSVFRRLRSGCEVDAVCTNPPRTRSLGTETSLFIFRPHVLNIS